MSSITPAQPLRILVEAARQIHQGSGPKVLLRQARFLWRAWAGRRHLMPVLQQGSAFQRHTLLVRPQALGLIEWPYLHCHWTQQERLAAFKCHHDLADSLPMLRVPVGMRRDLCSLDALEPGLRLVLDRPVWFLREGEICLNLFLRDTRIYTVAFNVDRNSAGALQATVGGVQGRSIEGARETYAHLTKVLHGARPRDFLIGVLLLICETLGIQTVRGVSDACRHHRSAYFAGGAEKTQTADYDEIWGDRGGVLANDGFFHLPAHLVERSLEEIPSKKRAMYRRRSELYAEVRAALVQAQSEDSPSFLPQLPG